jgi:hypothetical protein
MLLGTVTMKSVFFAAAALTSVLSASAVTFTPSPADLSDLDHHDATVWGISWTLPSNQDVTGATLTFKNIYDWQAGERDQLTMHLLDNPAQGVHVFVDNTSDTDFTDYFAGQGTLLAVWSDAFGGAPRNPTFDLVITFTASQVTALKNYLATAPTTSGGVTTANFGFGFDPDCHYYNDGVIFEITTTTKTVPDNGSSLALLGLGMAALGAMASQRNLRAVRA